MEQWERSHIRDLAKRVRELSETDEQRELVRLWKKHNDGQSERPMIHFEIATVQDAGLHYFCQCTSPDARDAEWKLGESMQNHLMVGDDRCVTPDFYISPHAGMQLFGLTAERTQKGLGYHIRPVIENLDTLDALHPSKMRFDEEGIRRDREFYGDLFGDILNIREGQGAFCFFPTNILVHLMSMENLFISMYDNPENFLIMMDRLADDMTAYARELERRGMLTPCCGNNFVAQGSFAFSDTMKQEAPISLKDMWGYLDSQETVNISPEMFDTFIFPAYKKIASLFGRLSYGCCEPVHPFWEKSLSRLDNLRKISISHWCDIDYMGEQLRGTGIVFLRKPFPLYVGGPDKNMDEDGFRAYIRDTMRAAEGCTLEIAFRDVYTLNGNLEKPRRAVEIIREEIENTWKQ